MSSPIGFPARTFAARALSRAWLRASAARAFSAATARSSAFAAAADAAAAAAAAARDGVASHVDAGAGGVVGVERRDERIPVEHAAALGRLLGREGDGELIRLLVRLGQALI